MFRYMMLYTSFSDWISSFLACMGGCFGCCAKSHPIIAVDEPSKGLRIQGRLVKKPSISEDFWSTSTCEMDNSMVQSQRSMSSISISTQSLSQQSGTGNSSNHSEFVNHGFLLWNQARLQWAGSKKSEKQKQVEEPILSWNASYESLLGTNKRFPQPIPLSEMVDFLVDIWEQEGLYEGCFGCCAKSHPIIAVDEPSKGLRIQGRLVKKPSISEDFWSTSTCEMDNSMVQSQRSMSSISISTQSLSQQSGTGNSSNHSEFVNHGFLLWNQARLQWAGSKKSEKQKHAEEPILSWNASYESLLGTNKRFPQPIPLSEMVDFLVDIWEQEGLYE